MSLTERIHSDHDLVKHLGNWTEAGHFEIKARHGTAVLDLRSPDLPDDVEIHPEHGPGHGGACSSTTPPPSTTGT